jgi:Carbohydrate-selective porin, OprB family/S-layer homology domain
MLNENLLSRLLVMPAFVGVALMAATPAFAANEQGANTADTLVSELATPEPLDEKLAPVAEGEAIEGETVTSALETAPLSANQPAVVAQALELDAEVAAESSVQDLAPVEESSISVLDEMTQYTENPIATDADPMGQVTSITQFSDVQPTDWAYQALQSLVERYGCIVGYPDGTFRGQRALTRFEFAAGMNACLDRISELLAASTADLATKEDLATLQRLQEEFAAELAALRGRVDVLDARTTELEANQFSTTTKLSGEAIFGVYDLFGGGLEDDDEDDDDNGNDLDANNNTAVAARVRLAFDTSFTGSDRLRARLQAANFDRFNTATLNGDVALGNDGRLGFDSNTDGDFQLDILSYLFSAGDVSFMVAPVLGDFTDFDFINPVSPFASGGRGAISRFGRYNPIYRTATGAGVGASFNFIDEVSLQLAYLAGESTSPDPGSGLFNGDYGALAQLTVKPFDAMTLAFTYVNSYSGSVENTDGTFSANGFNTGTGSLRSRVRVGDQPIVANSYAASVNFRVADFLQIGGWFGYSAVRVIETGDAQVWNYAGTIGFPDLGKKGSLLGFVVGVQPYLGGTSGFEVSDGNVLGRSDDNGLHVEGFYRFQLNDNISITPGVIWLASPNNNLDNEDVFIGALRTTFTF